MTDVLEQIDTVVADWEARPESWVPGDPLEDPIGLWVRPMFEVVDDLASVNDPRCVTCETYWVGPASCWECGLPSPEVRPMYPSRTAASWAPAPTIFDDDDPPLRWRVSPGRVAPISLSVTFDPEPFRAVMSRTAAAVTTLFADFESQLAVLRPAFAELAKALGPPAPAPVPHRPAPLPINGHEYARRRRNR